MPIISIVIPLYNKATLVERTLKSVLAQTFTDYEIIVVDDGSTDGSAEVAEAMNIPNLRLIRQQNAGVSAARNRGIEEAHGKYIALLDADDEWKPGYLATQIALTEKYPECEVFATNYEFHDSNGNAFIATIRNLPFKGEDGELSNYFKVAATSHPPLWTSAVMATKDALKQVGGFPVGIKSGEDLLTWARLAVKYKIAFSKKVCAVFNFDPVSFNADQKKRFPEKFDYVGDELKKLQQTSDKPYIQEYRAMWHKMRCRIFLDKGFKSKAFSESIKSLTLHFNPKVVVMLAMCILPDSLNRSILNRK